MRKLPLTLKEIDRKAARLRRLARDAPTIERPEIEAAATRWETLARRRRWARDLDHRRLTPIFGDQ